jgi:NarL family two-component system response regulator LiaR
VRSFLATNGDIDVCGEAVDGRDAIEKAKELHPDLVLMDISMPNINGLQATRAIRELLPQTEVVVLSQFDTARMAEEAHHAGAVGYVVKSSIAKSLFPAMEKAGRHEIFSDPDLASS